MLLSLYVFAAIVGWALLLFTLLSGDSDVDADLDAEVAAGAGWLSLRSLVFFLTLFGTVGLVLRLLSVADLAGVLIAAAAGLAGAFGQRALVRYLRRSESSSQVRVVDLEGARGRVVVPLDGNTRGKVTVDVGGQRLQLVARAARTDPSGGYEVGAAIVVVRLDGTTAVVARDEIATL